MEICYNYSDLRRNNVMKLLRVSANNFKNCADDFTINFVTSSKKTSEDKEYELIKVDEELYVFNTMAFVGKNASGKTTALELLDVAYSLLTSFGVETKEYKFKDVGLTMFFYHEGYIFKYSVLLNSSTQFEGKVDLIDQVLKRKKYYKSNVNSIFSNEGFNQVKFDSKLPNFLSVLYYLFEVPERRSLYFRCTLGDIYNYGFMFFLINEFKIETSTMSKIFKILDDNITSLEYVDDKFYRLTYNGKTMDMTSMQLFNMLSSGTTKGLLLYAMVIICLRNGMDLMIDEIENHFHKTLVENIISLFKDKTVNKYGSTLIFTTHYSELLDLFNRQDNIYITKADGKVYLENMYEKYDIRQGLLKSNLFYNNTFDTAVNYEDLMNLKKELF